MMNIGIGFSKQKETEPALLEAYRASLKGLKATAADFIFFFYSYEHTLDPAILSTLVKKVFRSTASFGASTWGAYSSRDGFEGEAGVVVISLKSPSFAAQALKVNSLREKADIWAAEFSRQMHESIDAGGKPNEESAVLIGADSLNFTPGEGFALLDRNFPTTPFLGFGTSFSVPQTSVCSDGEVYTNALVGLRLAGAKASIGISQNVLPELNAVSINRMSENLIIEIDKKPAFYRLCEHLMVKDDLPMMAQDEFRKQMGNLYLVERPKNQVERPHIFGSSYRVIPLLGSEMTTGMVAVSQPLDFACEHFLGQKKIEYAETSIKEISEQIKADLPQPSLVLVFISSARLRDRERQRSDLSIVQETFENTPVVAIATNGEFLGASNQFAALVMALA